MTLSMVQDALPGLDWRGIFVLLGALVAGYGLRAWKKKRGGSTRDREDAGSASNSRGGSGAVWRQSVGVLRETAGDRADDRAGAQFDSSPGRFGPEATRDLTAAEIQRLRSSYAPQLDGEPDPGEVVWTWVPYVENNGQGKDRPVLIIARIDDRTFAGCYLSTKEHRGFISVGVGGWDSQGRESFLSPERVLRIDTDGMRRESQAVPLGRFEQAVEAVKRLHRIGG